MKEKGGLSNAKMYTLFEQNIEPGRASTIILNVVQGFFNLDFENRLRPFYCETGVFSWFHIIFENGSQH